MLGNAWHIANNAEPSGQTSMRSPLEEIPAGAAVQILSGNQFQGFQRWGGRVIGLSLVAEYRVRIPTTRAVDGRLQADE